MIYHHVIFYTFLRQKNNYIIRLTVITTVVSGFTSTGASAVLITACQCTRRPVRPLGPLRRSVAADAVIETATDATQCSAAGWA